MALEGSRSMMQGAMRAGTVMGVFMIVKFVFFPLGLGNIFLLTLFCVLTCAVPFVGYRLTRIYRDNSMGGLMSFSQAWVFGMWMYLFASMLVAVGHFVYFRFIDNGYVLNYYQDTIDALAAAVPAGENALVEQLQLTLDVFYQFTPIDIVWQLLSQNVFYGSIIALITAPIVMRRKKYGSNATPTDGSDDNTDDSGQQDATA